MVMWNIRFILKAGKNKDLPGKKSIPNQAITGGVCGNNHIAMMKITHPYP